jgi:hypothetical protein
MQNILLLNHVVRIATTVLQIGGSIYSLRYIALCVKEKITYSVTSKYLSVGGKRSQYVGCVAFCFYVYFGLFATMNFNFQW